MNNWILQRNKIKIILELSCKSRDVKLRAITNIEYKEIAYKWLINSLYIKIMDMYSNKLHIITIIIKMSI